MLQKKGMGRDIETARQLQRDVHDKDEITPFEARTIIGISQATLHRYCAEDILECRRHPITKWRFIKRRSVEKLVKEYGLA